VTTPILVTGGTGTLGRLVVPRLQAAGAPVRVLSRQEHEPADGVDYVVGQLDTGAGLADALSDVDIVVHCAGTMKGDGARAGTLVRAAAEAGVRHLVNVSVVGADRIPVRSRADRAMFGYLAEKLAAEEAVAGSEVPWTTLRATQFHDSILIVLRAAAKLPVLPVFAGFRFQPVDARDVADRLVELALGEPAGLAPEFAGPEIHSMTGLVRDYLRAAGKHRLILPVPVPGGAARAYRAGGNLSPDRAVGTRTWAAFLAERFGAGKLSPVE
jgi:uncharacterized protein YbjT (DUF2867 family)